MRYMDTMQPIVWVTLLSPCETHSLNELLKSCTSVVNLFGIINTEPNLVYITNNNDEGDL